MPELPSSVLDSFRRPDFSDLENRERLKYVEWFHPQGEGDDADQNFARPLYPMFTGVASICDVGCGDGTFVYDAVTKLEAKHAIGVDIATVALGKVKHHPRITYFDAPANRIPLKDRSVEWATAFDVPEHWPRELVASSLGEMFRVARKGVVLKPSPKPSTKQFVRGVPQHLTVEPIGWWVEMLSVVTEDSPLKVRVEGPFIIAMVCH